MARPIKEGLTYFPVDVDIVQDEKIESLLTIHKEHGFFVFLSLLARIYRHGFFIDISAPETRQTLARVTNCISEEHFTTLLDFMFSVNLFNKKEYETRHILTSDGIKERYNFIKNKRLADRKRYQKKKVISVSETASETIPETPSESTSKRGESKVKQIKLKHIYTSAFNIEPLLERYPNKDGMIKARVYFNRDVKTQDDYDEIQIALENYLNSRRVKDGYVKNCSTWFNNWRDWINYTETKESDEEFKKKWGK